LLKPFVSRVKRRDCIRSERFCRSMLLIPGEAAHHNEMMSPAVTE
jgi:hypothetical protein